jgi:hypothetical protein
VCNAFWFKISDLLKGPRPPTMAQSETSARKSFWFRTLVKEQRHRLSILILDTRHETEKRYNDKSHSITSSFVSFISDLSQEA